MTNTLGQNSPNPKQKTQANLQVNHELCKNACFPSLLTAKETLEYHNLENGNGWRVSAHSPPIWLSSPFQTVCPNRTTHIRVTWRQCFKSPPPSQTMQTSLGTKVTPEWKPHATAQGRMQIHTTVLPSLLQTLVWSCTPEGPLPLLTTVLGT